MVRVAMVSTAVVSRARARRGGPRLWVDLLRLLLVAAAAVLVVVLVVLVVVLVVLVVVLLVLVVVCGHAMVLSGGAPLSRAKTARSSASTRRSCLLMTARPTGVRRSRLVSRSASGAMRSARASACCPKRSLHV